MLWNRRTKLDKIFGSGKGKDALTHFVSQENPSSSDLKQLDDEERSLWSSDFDPITPASFKFDSITRAWLPWAGDLSEISLPERLRLVTFNVLFGLYELGEKCAELQRWPLIAQLLKDTEADVILLQEMTERSLDRLQMEPWLQQDYFLTELSPVSDHRQQSTIYPYGQVVLSKFPIIETRLCRLNSGKRHYGHLLRLGNTFQLKLINVHLTSTKNESDDGAIARGVAKRLAQLQKGLDCINVDPDCMAVLAGDLNFGDSTAEAAELLNLLPLYRLKDVWTEANPELPGYTFIPSENTMAALTVSRHFEARRLDRILVRNGRDLNASVLGAKLIGTESATTATGEKIFPSDHYGIQVDFRLSTTSAVDKAMLNTLASVPSTFTSALCLIPPLLGPLHSLVQKLRGPFDPSYDRWPPHVNVLHGFVPENYFDQAELLVRNCATQLFSQPLHFTLSRFGIFELSNCAYVFLYLDTPDTTPSPTKVLFFPKVDSTEAIDSENFQVASEDLVISHPIAQLYQNLRQFLPLCGDRDRHVIVPHLTVGKFQSLAEAKLAAVSWQQSWLPIKWTVGQCELISRSASTPFSVIKTARWIEGDSKDNTRFSAESAKWVREETALEITNILRSANIAAVPLWLGSVALGTEDVMSDADLCMLVTISPLSCLELLTGNPQLKLHSIKSGGYADRLEFPKIHLWQSVLKGSDSLLHLARYREETTKEFNLELTFAQVPPTLLHKPTVDWSLEELRSLDRASLLAVSGVNDALVIRSLLGTRLQKFQQFCRSIKRWASGRGVAQKNFGFPPSVAWTLMAASLFLDSDATDTDDDRFLHFFFAKFAAKSNWDPSEGQAIALNDQSNQFGQQIFTSQDAIVRGAQHMAVLSPSYPHNNQCRNLTASTYAIVKAELTRAYQLTRMVDNPAELCQWPTDDLYSIRDAIEVRIDLRFTGDLDEVCQYGNFPPDLERLCHLPVPLQLAYGWLESQIISIILQLESTVKKLKVPVESGILVRPIPKVFVYQPDSLQIRLRVNVGSNHRNQIERSMTRFQARWDEVRLKSSDFAQCDLICTVY